MRCAVNGCNVRNKRIRNKTVESHSLYSFPKESDKCQIWIDFCQRRDKFHVRNSRICAKHFTQTDFQRVNEILYDYGFEPKKRLKPNVVPTLCPAVVESPTEEAKEERSRVSTARLIASNKQMEQRKLTNGSGLNTDKDKEENRSTSQPITARISDKNRKKEEQTDCATTTSLVIAKENETVHEDELLIKDEVCSNYSTTEFIIEEHEPIQSTNASHEMTKRCWNGVNEVTQTAKRKKLSDIDSRLEDVLQCIKSLKNKIENRDEHAVFGEFIAHKIRSCNKNEREISIAQHHIENVLFNLTMGTYGKEVKLSSASNEIITAEESQSNELIIP